MGVLQGLYENTRRASDHARRRVFEGQERLEAARREVLALEAALVGAERDLRLSIAAEAEARRRWVARSRTGRKARTSGGVVTAIASLAATVREGVGR